MPACGQETHRRELGAYDRNPLGKGEHYRTLRVSTRKSFPAEQNPAGVGVNKAEPTRNLVGPGHLPPDLATPFASYSSIV